MIQLTKTERPEILSLQGDAWTQEYVELLHSEMATDSWRKYAHDDIKNALKSETRDKCAYCESHIDHVSYPHVEHILPKSRRPDLVCDWLNLTLACTVCNTEKSDYYDEQVPLVNPYQDAIEDHLRFYGPLAIHITTDRGKVTVSRLKLNRERLTFKRSEAIKRARSLLESIESAANTAVRAILEEELSEMCSDGSEYAGAVRRFVADFRANKLEDDAAT